MEKDLVKNGPFHARLRAWEVIAGIAIIGLMVLALLSCGSPSDDTPGLENVTWVLKSFGDAANPTKAVTGHEPTLTFDKSKMKIGGNNGVNSYSGDYTLNGNKLTMTNLMQTLMAGPEPLMSQETAYMKILPSIQSFEITDTLLTLTGREGVLEFLRK
jgi:heat shock protein HslJ